MRKEALRAHGGGVPLFRFITESWLKQGTTERETFSSGQRYKASGLRMNQKIAMKDSWGLPELEERNTDLLAYARTIWSYPTTSFVPAEKEFDSCTLDDENADLTGRDIVKYSYQNLEQPVTSWADMLEHVVKYLHQKDKSVLTGLAYSQSSTTDLVSHISTDPKKLRSAFKVDDDIYFEKGSSTALKLSILRRLFALYGLDPMDLVFYLRDAISDKVADESRFVLRKRYWTYALPLIQKAHSHRGLFSNANPTTSNWCSGYFGIGGFSISCIANYSEAWVTLWMGSGDAAKNKRGFDILFEHKEEIEEQIGTSDLNWDRANENKASWITYTLKGVSITNEADWQRMAKFHAEWSAKFADAMIPYLAVLNSDAELNPEKAEKNKALFQLATLAKGWAVKKSEGGLLSIDLARCNQAYIRFRTTFMDEVFPDAPGTKSGWNTTNHYFYEIVNRTGNSIYIQLALSAKEMPKDQLETSDRINEFYPTKNFRTDWQWRTPFRTGTVEFDDIEDKEAVFAKLDECLQEVCEFEKNLCEILQ